VYADANDRFSEEELVKLTVAIGLINPCNPLAIGHRYIYPIGTSKAALAFSRRTTPCGSIGATPSVQCASPP
jgi:hypothetical protein